VRRLLLALLIAGTAGWAAAAMAADGGLLSSDDPAFVIAGQGVMGDKLATGDPAAAFSLAYRAGPRLAFFYIRPSLGLLVSNEGSVYGWLGLGLDLFLGRRFVLTPEFGAGAFSAGGGQTLGHVFEMRTGGTLALRFDDRARIGLGLHHISNLGLGNRNPGTETLGLYFALPLAR